MSSFSKHGFDLSPSKQALLDALLQAEGVNTSPPRRITRRHNDDSLPLSFAQQRLWFLDQLLPANPFYNIPAALRLTNPLNVSALARSLNEIVRRHEALRTTFATVNGVPVQIIASELQLALPVTDLRHLLASEREAEALRLARAEAEQPFDLARGPLLRTSLLRLDEADYVFLLTLHHIVSDGWSGSIFFQELTALYQAYALGRESPLAELPIQYADYAVWQRERLQGAELEEHLSYWREQLRDLPVLALPTDRPRPAVQSFRGAEYRVKISPPVAAGLRALSQAAGVTLFMTLLATFKVLLYRYTGQADIVVGSPIAGRNHAELEGLIGFFINTLVFRTRVSGEMSFRELLAQVREVCVGAYAHQELPFEMLVEKLQPERDLSRNPIFQVVFQLMNTPSVTRPYEDQSPALLEIKRETAKFDLTFDLWEGPGPQDLTGQLEYNTDLFDAATIERLARHFQTLLEAILTDPGQPVAQLSLLSVWERRQLLVEWNRTASAYPREASVHRLFEAQVACAPEAVAVVFEDEQVSYRELNRRANQLARYLHRRGVGPQTLVGVLVERSADMVVSLLGVLKAGGAYVPLDADYPPDRLRFMAEDAEVVVVVTQERLAGRLVGQHGSVVQIDGQWDEIAQESGENLESEVSAEHLAYVMYTSGSTGRPKGVAIPHRAINRLVCNTNYINLDSSDSVAQASTFSFDAATFEIWGALLNGARLTIITKDVALSPAEFAAQLRRQAVTTVFLTPPLFNQLIGEAPGAFSSVRNLLIGGSSADPNRLRELLEQGPPQRLLHVYGPTESTTFASWELVEGVPQGTTIVPIGSPLSNTEIYILDSRLQPVPVGVTGQLLIGGDGLARGYLRRPELTAEKFIPHPFSAAQGARLYQTGDLARYLPDGRIEFLGRADEQVKLRGFRIELGEIEAVLCEHPAVREAAVVAQAGEVGDKRLLAYVVAEREQTVWASEIRAYLREKLPEYMVPSAYVLLDGLPLTPSGKVDRRALPQPDSLSPELAADYMPPQTELEQTIAVIWQEALGLDKVGIHDNFFDLGGHSLLMVKVHAKLSEAAQKNVSMTDLFRYPTISALAKYLSNRQAEPSSFQQIQERAKKQKEALSKRRQILRGRSK